MPDDIRADGRTAVAPARHAVTLPCAADPDLFFSVDPADIEQARQICAGCPRRASCLQDAIANQPPCGVWGGHLFVNGQIASPDWKACASCGLAKSPLDFHRDSARHDGRRTRCRDCIRESRAIGGPLGGQRVSNEARTAERDERLARFTALCDAGRTQYETATELGLPAWTRQRYWRLYQASRTAVAA